MTDVQRYMMKLAEERSRLETVKERLGVAAERTKKFVKSLGTRGIKRKELRTIRGQIRDTKPETAKEKAVERLAGKKYTPGQYARRAGVGAVIGSGAQAVGSLIEGGRARKAGFKPRALGRAAAIGALFGSAIPAASRLADIEAAKRGAF